MRDKSIKIRNYILDLIESGTLNAGERLPGARKIAQKLNSSFTHVQGIVESLVQCGILKAVPRSGTYIAEDWMERLLPCNFVSYSGNRIGILNEIIDKLCMVHGFRPCVHFRRGIAEIRVSHYLLSHHDEYMDLGEIFRDCFGDGDAFYKHVLNDFYVNGKLCGIPLVFSPRLILCNPEVFRRCSCPLPRKDWTWEEFLETIRCLNQSMNPEFVFNWVNAIQNFNTFFTRAGGTLFSSMPNARPEFASEAGIRGYQYYVQLRDLTTFRWISEQEYFQRFSNDEAAMVFGPRQIMYDLKHYNPSLKVYAVKLPVFPQGSDINIQGADLLCIRKDYTDIDQIRSLVKYALSEELQDMVAAADYGIPFRRSSAAKTLDPDSPCDSVFIEEIPKISAAYRIYSPEIYRMIILGSAHICSLPYDQLVPEIRKFATAVDVMLKLQEFEKNMEATKQQSLKQIQWNAEKPIQTENQKTSDNMEPKTYNQSKRGPKLLKGFSNFPDKMFESAEMQYAQNLEN